MTAARLPPTTKKTSRRTPQNALAYAEERNLKINFVDMPGFPMFVHQARAALLPVEAALLVVNAACGWRP